MTREDIKKMIDRLTDEEFELVKICLEKLNAKPE